MRGRLVQALEVLAMAEDGGPPLGLVGADALEDAGSVVQAVAEHVDLGVVPCDELAVHPDALGLLHAVLLVARIGFEVWRMDCQSRRRESAAQSAAITASVISSVPTRRSPSAPVWRSAVRRP